MTAPAADLARAHDTARHLMRQRRRTAGLAFALHAATLMVHRQTFEPTAEALEALPDHVVLGDDGTGLVVVREDTTSQGAIWAMVGHDGPLDSEAVADMMKGRAFVLHHPDWPIDYQED